MRSFVRRRRLFLAVAAVFLGLSVNVWVQDGLKPFLIVLAAVFGCLTVAGSVGYVTGAQVVRHARNEATAIESGRHPYATTMRELSR